MNLRCPRCRAENTDGLLCEPCTNTYLTALDDLARFLPELQVTVQREDRVARAVVHGLPDDEAEQEQEQDRVDAARIPAHLRSRMGLSALAAMPLPVNLSAADLMNRVVRDMAQWVLDVGGPFAADPLAWLLANPDPVRGSLAARDIVFEAVRDRDRVERAIDRREPDVFVGRCDAPDVLVEFEDGTIRPATEGVCGVELYACIDDTEVTCEACGYQYRIADRREWLLEQARDVLERPTVIADALTTWGIPLTAAKLDNWISRDRRLHEQGRRHPKGFPLILADPVFDEHDRPLYRVGDVIARVEALRAWEQERLAS